MMLPGNFWDFCGSSARNEAMSACRGTSARAGRGRHGGTCAHAHAHRLLRGLGAPHAAPQDCSYCIKGDRMAEPPGRHCFCTVAHELLLMWLWLVSPSRTEEREESACFFPDQARNSADMLKALQCCAGQSDAGKRTSKGPHALLDASNEPDGHAQGGPCAGEAMPQKPSEQVCLCFCLVGVTFSKCIHKTLAMRSALVTQGCCDAKGGTCPQSWCPLDKTVLSPGTCWLTEMSLDGST